MVNYEISYGLVLSATLLVLAYWCSNVFYGLQTMHANVQQRWARYFFKVPAVPVLGTLLKVPAGSGI